MTCDAKIRPFPGSTELSCEQTGEHSPHEGTLRDYAYSGSVTVVKWFETDRRNYHGEWPGRCTEGNCILPLNHRSDHSR